MVADVHKKGGSLRLGTRGRGIAGRGGNKKLRRLRPAEPPGCVGRERESGILKRCDYIEGLEMVVDEASVAEWKNKREVPRGPAPSITSSAAEHSVAEECRRMKTTTLRQNNVARRCSDVERSSSACSVYRTLKYRLEANLTFHSVVSNELMHWTPQDLKRGNSHVWNATRPDLWKPRRLQADVYRQKWMMKNVNVLRSEFPSGYICQ